MMPGSSSDRHGNCDTPPATGGSDMPKLNTKSGTRTKEWPSFMGGEPYHPHPAASEAHTREYFLPPIYTHLLQEFTELQKPLSFFQELPKELVHQDGDEDAEIEHAQPPKKPPMLPAGSVDETERSLTIGEMEKAKEHMAPGSPPVKRLPGTPSNTVALCLRDVLRYFAKHMDDATVRAVIGDVATKQTRRCTLIASDMNMKARSAINAIVNDCNGLVQGAMLLAMGKVARPAAHPAPASNIAPPDYLGLTPLVTGIIEAALSCSTDFADVHVVNEWPVVIYNTDSEAPTPTALAFVKLSHSHHHHWTFFKKTTTIPIAYECSVLVFTESHQETFRRALQWVLHQMHGFEKIAAR